MKQLLNMEEEFRNIRSNIIYGKESKNKNAFVFASPVKENITEITCKIGEALANVNKKLLLIDGDLREPLLQEYFNISNDKGLTDHLLEKSNIENYINKQEGIDILTAGEKVYNPSELLSSPEMQEFLEKIKYEYDYIFIKGHHINNLTDSVVLSTMTDGIILVVPSGTTKMTEIKSSISALNRVNANVIGVIFNNRTSK